MKIDDEGLFLYSKNFGENSKIMYIFSRENGLIKGLSKSSKKKNNNLINFDKIKFSWSSRDENALGFLNVEQQFPNTFDHYIFSVIKASASELCIKFLPLWERNLNIYNEIIDLSVLKLKSDSYLIGKYINWEINFLKNLGYGLNIDRCSVSGKTGDAYYISPRTANAVSFNIGKKYAKKLFKIPACMKDNFQKDFYNDYKEALQITEYYFLRILEKKDHNFIFRNQIIKIIENL
tara:strand:- start:253 stop:957 length:705 start_codon:yes stop_codon:yes gene_type:complete